MVNTDQIARLYISIWIYIGLSSDSLLISRFIK
jgi:hypothetical protein